MCLPGCQNGYCTIPGECVCLPNWTGVLCNTCAAGMSGPNCNTRWCHKHLALYVIKLTLPLAAICSVGCQYGTCAVPGICTCNAGWSNANCSARASIKVDVSFAQMTNALQRCAQLHVPTTATARPPTHAPALSAGLDPRAPQVLKPLVDYNLCLRIGSDLHPRMSARDVPAARHMRVHVGLGWAAVQSTCLHPAMCSGHLL